MKNHPANDPYPKTLSFSPFVSGTDDVSVLKKAVLRLLPKSSRQIMPPPGTANREAAARSIFKWNAVSRYDVDAYGRPRILSKWEVIFHALAWPVVAGSVIGFGLAIFLVAVQDPSPLKPQEKSGQPQVALQEVEP